jgi:hypothetical protein
MSLHVCVTGRQLLEGGRLLGGKNSPDWPIDKLVETPIAAWRSGPVANLPYEVPLSWLALAGVMQQGLALFPAQ